MTARYYVDDILQEFSTDYYIYTYIHTYIHYFVNKSAKFILII